MANKYYWLRLQRDFFKRHDIRIIESMTNGKDYILFYLKLLVELLPYGEYVDSEIVRAYLYKCEDTSFANKAMEVLINYELLRLIDPNTYYVSDLAGKSVLSRNVITSRNRSSQIYKWWRKEVFERDDYTCQHCGKRGAKLNAHHIKTFKDYPQLRYVVDNGITLCEKCHRLEHKRMRENGNI